jgi:hypothetical protein
MVVNLDAVFGGFQQQRETFTPSAAQTIFPLAAPPAVASYPDTVVRVNQVPYGEGVVGGSYFTVSGSQITWSNQFVLDVNDVFEVVYFI